MKKVRINLKRNQKSWSLTVYDSSESAFYMSETPEKNDFDSSEYCSIVTLSPGEVIEAEWLGSEYVYKDELAKRGTHVDAQTSEKYEKVRLGKLTSVKTEAMTRHFVELHSGWVLGGTVPWAADDTRKDIRIIPIKGRIRSKLDFTKLFPVSTPLESGEEVDKYESEVLDEKDVN